MRLILFYSVVVPFFASFLVEAQDSGALNETVFDERTWTSADGSSSFVGTLTKLDSGKVTIEKEGESLTFSVEKLSPADLEFIGQAITITTMDGKTHENVSVSRISPDSIMFTKPSGVVTIPMENLPEDLRTRFGFDPEKAEMARISQAKRQAEQRSQMAAQLEAQNKRMAKEAQLAEADLRDAFVYRFVEGGIIFQSIGTIKDSDGERSAKIIPDTGWGYKQILDGRNTDTEYFLEGVPETPALVDDQPFSAYMIPNGTYEFGSSRIRSFKFLKWGGVLYEEDQKFNTPTVVRKVE